MAKEFQYNYAYLNLNSGGGKFSCTCIDGAKKRWCEHRVGMVIKRQMVRVPEEAKFGVELGKKRKRGRPRHATRAREYNMMY